MLRRHGESSEWAPAPEHLVGRGTIESLRAAHAGGIMPIHRYWVKGATSMSSGR
jgi:hypothetical protein